MAFNVENGTGGVLDIGDLGITLDVGEITDLSLRTDPLTITNSLVTGEEMHTLITAGDLIVKDPLLGTNLSVVDGIICARSHNDPHFRVGLGARIGDISDVTLATPAANEILQFNGTNWGNIPQPIEISTLDGQPIPTFIDSTRSNKRLSVETIPLMWSDGSIRREDWIPIGRSSGEGNGYSVPHQGTIVKVTADSLHNNGVSRHIDLYMNKILNTASLVTFTGIPNGPEKFEDVTLDIDFTVANVLQLRADNTGTAGVSLEDCVLVLWIKWRI